jgi:drug/metabolite transporter (DMT)-like permease
LNKSNSNFYSGIGLALLAVLIWSGNYVVARGIYKQIPPVSLGFYRWLLASVCLIPLAWKRFQDEKNILGRHKPYLFWTAITGVTIFNTFIYLAGHYTSAINLALIGTTAAPVFATILAAIFLKEKIGILRVAGTVICFMGIFYLLSGGNFQRLKDFHFGKGDLLILFSAFNFAIYNTLVRKKPTEISPIVFLFVVFALGTICLFPFYLFEWMNSAPVQWNRNMIVIIIYLGVGNSIISFFCWNASISRLGASGTALFANLIPVFSAVEAVFFLGEEFSTLHMVSSLVILIGLIVANLKRAT